MQKKNLLIIVPARGGSTGLKNKNILKLGKRHLVYYSLKAGVTIKEKSKTLICSTDNNKIKNIVEQMGFDCPFIRPKNISGKFATDITFVNHAINFFYNKKIAFKFGLILRPTSPFRNKEILNHAYSIFKKSSYESMRAITNATQTPFRMWNKKGNEIRPILRSKYYEHYNIPRQKLPKVYFQAGNFEFFKIMYKPKIKSVSGSKIYGYLINNFLSADIDKLDDLKQVKKLFRENKSFIK